MDPSPRNAVVSTPTRRRVLAGTATAVLGGTGLLAVTSDPVSAQVTMGELTLAGDTADLDAAPSRVDVHVTGEYQVTMANGPPEMTTLTTQARVGPEPLVDDIGSTSEFDSASGTFDVTYDLLGHSDVDGAYLMPAEDGGTKTTSVTIRQVVGVVNGGSLIAEAYAEGTAELTVNHNGVVVAVGGEASLDVVA